MRTTHTYSILHIDARTYRGVRERLLAAGADRDDEVIDLHGIAIQSETVPLTPTQPSKPQYRCAKTCREFPACRCLGLDPDLSQFDFGGKAEHRRTNMNDAREAAQTAHVDELDICASCGVQGLWDGPCPSCGYAGIAVEKLEYNSWRPLVEGDAIREGSRLRLNGRNPSEVLEAGDYVIFTDGTSFLRDSIQEGSGWELHVGEWLSGRYATRCAAYDETTMKRTTRGQV